MAADDFFSRWSRRKVQARVATPEPAQLPPHAEAPPPAVQPEAPLVLATPAPVASTAEVPPLPTLADVDALTPASDYGRFVARDVRPEVRNAALKKLFTDPHFNVMDGLDTYIDDYNKPDPLPDGWLRKMVQSQLLGLFADEEQPAADAAAPATPLPPDPAADENTDLQLQPDDDAGRPGPAPGAGEDAGRQH